MLELQCTSRPSGALSKVVERTRQDTLWFKKFSVCRTHQRPSIVLGGKMIEWGFASLEYRDCSIGTSLVLTADTLERLSYRQIVSAPRNTTRNAKSNKETRDWKTDLKLKPEELSTEDEFLMIARRIAPLPIASLRFLLLCYHLLLRHNQEFRQ